MPEIILNLDTIRDPQAFDDPNQVLHQEAMKAFFRHIGESLDQAGKYPKHLESYNGSISRTRRHNTITISGSRGSGKTTFLINMLQPQDRLLSDLQGTSSLAMAGCGAQGR